MAGNYLTLHTNDRVVVTTSRGNQEKWFDTEKNLWYKADGGCFEALAEAVSSEVLRNFTNAARLPGISVANYWVDTAEVHGLKRVVSVSENFKREDESLITANTILKNSLGTGYLEEFNRRTSLKERIRLLVDAMEEATGMQNIRLHDLMDFNRAFQQYDTPEEATGMQNMGEYLTTLFEIDALFLNQDRHLNNIALIRDRSRYKPCPIFDCGDSFLLDFALYSPEIESRAYLTKAQCLPFKSRFTQTVHTAQTLYGKQLAVNIDKTGIDTILDKYLCYYPKQFHFLLKERIETVLIKQQKKLFEK